jgi:hypothetical protein
MRSKKLCIMRKEVQNSTMKHRDDLLSLSEEGKSAEHAQTPSQVFHRIFILAIVYAALR